MGTSVSAGYENLVLEGIEGVIHIEHLKIHQEINEHTRMDIQFLLADSAVSGYEGELFANRDICLCTDNGEILFYGIIVDNELYQAGGVHWLRVSAASHHSFGCQEENKIMAGYTDEEW